MNKQRPTELRDALSELYNVEPTGVELVSQAVNHTYRVDIPGDHLFFRQYFPNAYFGSNKDDFLFELEFVVHLAENGVAVPRPIPTRAGLLMASVEVDGHEQYGALFPAAAGAPHRAWWPEIRDDGVVRELGALLARLHNTADTFSCDHSRYEFDLHFLVEKPLALLQAAMGAQGRSSEMPAIHATARAAHQVISRLGKGTDVYGPIHADAHVGNVFYDEEVGFTLIDFDHCAYGWRVYDLVPLFNTLELNVPDALIVERVRTLVLEGYETRRKLSDSERESIPAFQVLWHLWDIGENLVLSSTWGGPIAREAETRSSFLDDAVRTIEQAAKYLT